MGKQFIKYITIFLIFSVTYYFIEILFSGSSNWSSLLMGGIGGILISLINYFYSYSTPKWKQITLTTFIMIFIELIGGLLLRAFGFEFWNYSGRFLNVERLICLRYSIYWGFLSIFALQLEDYIDYIYFNGDKPDGLVVYIGKFIKGK